MESTDSPSKNEIFKYMNMLARSYNIFIQSQEDFNVIQTKVAYNEVYTATKSRLDAFWRTASEISDFLQQVNSTIEEMELSEDENRTIEAIAVCIWLDNHISYEKNLKREANNYFFVHKLVPVWGHDEVMVLDSMNTNYVQTGIQIIPKFEIAEALKELGSKSKGRANPAANRDAFSGLNGVAQKVCFVAWEKNIYIHNIIVPPRFIRSNTDTFNVAFCPLTDKDVVQRKIEPVTNGTLGESSYNGINVTGIRNSAQLLERLKEDWQSACINGKANVVFFPEMLGIEAMEETESNGKENKLIKQMALALSKEGYLTPYFTILPSYWRDGCNSATIVDRDGCIVGQQKKYRPYVDGNKHVKEALKITPDKHYYIVHIPKVHRIVILICSEFLSICNGERNPLFKEACCTLVLVPSYTRGEIDFMNSLQALKCYGTTVVWGNNCGVAGQRKIGGATCLAGLYNVKTFSEIRECGGSCKSDESCVFIVSLPLRRFGLDLGDDRKIIIKQICMARKGHDYAR